MCTHYVAYYNTLPRIEKVGLSSSQLPPLFHGHVLQPDGKGRLKSFYPRLPYSKIMGPFPFLIYETLFWSFSWPMLLVARAHTHSAQPE